MGHSHQSAGAVSTASSYRGGALLALNGEFPPAEKINALLTTCSPIVAADGAALKLRALGIPPHVIVGDLDSVAPHLHDPFFESTLIVERPDQEDYDGAKALAWIAEQGHNCVSVIGVAGGMIDHVLNNFSLLARHAGNLLISLHNADCTGYFVRSGLHAELHITAHPGDRISLVPMPRARLHTEGLQWNLSGEDVVLGGRSGTSNSAIAADVRITVLQANGEAEPGCAVVFHYAGNVSQEHSLFP